MEAAPGRLRHRERQLTTTVEAKLPATVGEWYHIHLVAIRNTSKRLQFV